MLSEENIDAVIEATLITAEIAVVNQSMQQTCAQIAQATVLARLWPLGGVTGKLDEMRGAVQTGRKHLEELRAMRVELMEGPLADPTKLDVVTRSIHSGNGHDRRR